MSLPRSTCYATPKEPPSDAGLTAEIRAITDEFECYGYRRVGAELRRRGRVVNAKKLRRLMRENELNPRRRRRFTRTTDSGHDGPVFPFVARGLKASGPDQLWVGDITYVAVAQGFVYLSVILDAWSRRVIGHAIARDLEARHSVAALERAIALRRPEGCCTTRGARALAETPEGRRLFERKLHLHQSAAIARDENYLVATGAGSGKTEAFLFPLIDGSFAKALWTGRACGSFSSIP
jgi:putative transposase